MLPKLQLEVSCLLSRYRCKIRTRARNRSDIRGELVTDPAAVLFLFLCLQNSNQGQNKWTSTRANSFYFEIVFNDCFPLQVFAQWGTVTWTPSAPHRGQRSAVSVRPATRATAGSAYPKTPAPRTTEGVPSTPPSVSSKDPTRLGCLQNQDENETRTRTRMTVRWSGIWNCV